MKSPTTKNIGSYQANREHSDAKKNVYYGMTADDWLALLTLGLLLVGGFQVRLFYRQLRLIREGLEPARDAAEAAKLDHAGKYLELGAKRESGGREYV